MSEQEIARAAALAEIDRFIEAWQRSGVDACHGEIATLRLVREKIDALPTLPSRTPESGQLQIGDKVEVIGKYEADWRGIDAWVAGVQIHDSGVGLDIALTEQWPPRGRHSHGYLGWTDGFRPEELRRLAASPTPSPEGAE